MTLEQTVKITELMNRHTIVSIEPRTFPEATFSLVLDDGRIIILYDDGLPVFWDTLFFGREDAA